MDFTAIGTGLGVVLADNGAIASIRRHGRELGAPAAEAFTMELLDRNGEALRLRSREFRREGGVFTAHPAMPSLKVAIAVRADRDFVRFRPQVTGVPGDWVVSWIDAPQVCYPLRQGIDLVLPLHDGVIISDPTLRKAPYHPIGFAKRGQPYGTFYPGRAQLQCMAFCRGGDGVYFAAQDPHCATKAVEYEVCGEAVRLSLQTFTGCDFGQDYRPDWDYVLAGIDGDWQSAAELYRDWVEAQNWLPPMADYPEWMRQSPVVAIYPVRGHGRDVGEMEPNCYFLYVNAMPHIRRFQKEFGAPILALLMHWEGTAPWAPPFVWPPFGGEAALAKFRDALHDSGNLLGLYCSGTAWTCSSSILPGYAPGCTPEQERMMLRGPKGELEASVCNGLQSQRLGYELCLAEAPARKIVLDEILKMADFGVDYAQFFDQNHGGCVHNCFARDHHHPPVPGGWQAAMQHGVMAEAAREIGARGRSMLLGCESAAADVYAQFLSLNDARASFVRYYGRPIPMQQYVLHGRSANFAGNQGGTRWICDFSRSPYNLNRRLAYAFSAGDLLSVTLKEDGHAHWCWSYEWDRPAPPQPMFWTLMRNLNQVRRQYPEYLLLGRMQRDAAAVTGETCVEYDCEGRKREFPAFCHSTWQAPDGRRALIAANYLDRPQRLAIDGKPTTVAPCSAIVVG